MSDNRSSNFLQEAFQKHMRNLSLAVLAFTGLCFICFSLSAFKDYKRMAEKRRHDQSVVEALRALMGGKR